MSKIFFLFLLISTFSYGQVSIEKNLKEQLKDGESSSLGEEFESHKFSEKDLQAIISIIKQELINNNFQFLKESDFNIRVTKIFNRIIDVHSDKAFLYLNFNEKCDKDPIYTLSPIYSGSFIIKKEAFITELYAIPQLFDYQKEFPELAIIKNGKIKKKNPDLGQEIEIPHWRDVPNLKEIRKKNIQTIVARNMYLFNDNKAQYKWLILNDQYFMESLVKIFGYTEDSDLLKWVIERTKFDKNNPQDYGKLFWTKKCDGSAKLHANTFKILQKLYTPDIRNDMSNDNRFLLNYIKDYIEYFADDNNKEANVSNEYRVKILANISYYAEQYKYDKRFVSGHGDNSMIMGRLRFFLSDEDVELLKKNNYFSLPKFKEWWNNADYDEYYVTECEYGGSCSPDNPVLNKVEWRKTKSKEIK